MVDHTYDVEVVWTGDRGTGTSGYSDYARDHEVRVAGRPPIPASADAAFRGAHERFNPEELLVAALSSCHMLWYLHLCADAGVVVVEYVDAARGTMRLDEEGLGEFVEVVLAPRVAVTDEAMVETATELHEAASMRCFVARSVRFPVRHEPRVEAARPASSRG